MTRPERGIKAAGATSVGRRKANEDALDWWVAPDGGYALAVVADGVGGEAGGARASALAVTAIMAALEQGVAGDDEVALQRAVAEAEAAVHGARQSDPAVAAMATTVVAALARPGGVTLAHVGDSRAYHWRQGKLRQLTHDHTVVQQMVDDGVLKPEQRDRVPFAHVLSRAVGPSTATAQITVADWQPGERLLLCSDGLNAALPEDTIASVLSEPSPEDAVRRLIDEAERTGAPDNITIILLEPY